MKKNGKGTKHVGLLNHWQCYKPQRTPWALGLDDGFQRRGVDKYFPDSHIVNELQKLENLANFLNVLNFQ